MSAPSPFSVLAWLDRDRFAAWSPVTLELMDDSGAFVPWTADLAKSGASLQLGIDAIASTEAIDADGEIIRQDGIVWKGAKVLTLEHPLGTFNRCGDVIKLSRCDVGGVPATRVKGAVWKAHRVGSRVAEELEGLAKSKALAQWGVSFEGRALERSKTNPKDILRSECTSLALTPAPKNPLCLIDPIMASMFGAAIVAEQRDNAARQVDVDPLIKGIAREDLAALRILARFPEMSLAEARAHQQWSQAA